ncbi:hypothetical protein HYQ44_006292, partial [Verticillium longisporum]
MPEGRQSPEPERQSGKQQQSPPGSGQGTDNADNKEQVNADQLQNLSSNPKGDGPRRECQGAGGLLKVATEAAEEALGAGRNAVGLVGGLGAIGGVVLLVEALEGVEEAGGDAVLAVELNGALQGGVAAGAGDADVGGAELCVVQQKGGLGCCLLLKGDGSLLLLTGGGDIEARDLAAEAEEVADLLVLGRRSDVLHVDGVGSHYLPSYLIREADHQQPTTMSFVNVSASIP